MDNRKVVVSLEGASVGYQGRSLMSDVDLTIRPGDSLAILGPNGRGKTTLLKALLGTLPLISGKRFVAGDVGYVPQVSSSGYNYSVREMVLMGRARRIGFFGNPKREDYDIVDRVLADLGLERYADTGVQLLSGGERQLVMIARALVAGIDLLILDEPASALDLARQRFLFDNLNRLRHEQGIAMVFSTHAPGHAFLAADFVLLMHTNGPLELGQMETVLNDDALSRLYGTPIRILREHSPHGHLASAVALPKLA